MNNESKLWGSLLILSVVALIIVVAYKEGLMDSVSSDSSGDDTPIVLGSTADTPDPKAFDCINHSGIVGHYHALLRISINGDAQTIPANVGVLTNACNTEDASMHIIHTHDDAGTLHIELNEPGPVELGVFFDIWGLHFNETGIADFRIDAEHEFLFYVNGELSTSYDDHILEDGQVIDLVYREKQN